LIATVINRRSNKKVTPLIIALIVASALGLHRRRTNAIPASFASLLAVDASTHATWDIHHGCACAVEANAVATRGAIGSLLARLNGHLQLAIAILTKALTAAARRAV
jgi:hypothetical protein